MSRKKSRFILEEAEVDDEEEEDEETDHEDSNDELDNFAEWNDPEYWQDKDIHTGRSVSSNKPHADEGSPMDTNENPHLRELHTLAEHLEERYVQHRASLAHIPLDADNEVSNQDLRICLQGLPGPSNIYRLKCKRGHETTLVMEIARCFVSPGQPEGPDRPMSLTLLRSPTPPSLPDPSQEARGWEVVQRFALGSLRTLPETETELQNVYGDQYNHSQWQDILRRINDQEDDEDTPTILAEIDKHLSSSKPDSSSSQPGPPLRSQPSNHSPHSSLPSIPDQALSKHGDQTSRTIYPVQQWSNSHVYSAFTVPSVLGSIYVEARIDQDFRQWLRQRVDVVHSSTGDVTLEVVDQAEVGQLLSSSCPSIEPFTWIRVTKGMYRHDVGLVLSRESAAGARRLKILLVPRLRIGRTRKTRNPQALFNPNNFSSSDTIALGDHRYQYQGHLFDHGLIEVIVDYSSVTYTDVEPDRATRLFFAQSGHLRYHQHPMPTPQTWVFCCGERVRVHCPEPLAGEDWENKSTRNRKTYQKNGEITCVERHRCQVEFDEGAALWQDIRNLRKAIRIGDFVEIVGGAHTGKSGLVHDTVGDNVDLVVGRNPITNLSVHVNMCRVTQIHLKAAVPWIDEHVTIKEGMYLNYTGTVVDVHPPKPFTVVDVYIPQLLQTVKVKHDHVVHTISSRPLRHAHPLSTSQQAFRQSDWDLQLAPNFSYGPDAVGSTVSHQYTIGTPPVPWQHVEVLIIGGEWKGKGFVKNVERQPRHKSRSGVMVIVELQRWSASSGANPLVPIDYSSLRDLRSGLGLNEAYPLRGRQRYFEPRFRVSAIDPIRLRALLPASPPSTPQPRASTPTVTDEDVITDADAWNPSASMPYVWPLLPELDGKKFLATYRSREEGTDEYTLRKGLEVQPHLSARKVLVWTGREHVFVQPDDILPCQDKINPTRTRKAMLVISGEHIGKYIRPITNKYTPEGKAVFTAKTFNNWGQTDESLVDEWIEIAPEHLARITDDPNEKRWSTVMRIARDAAVKPKPPRKK
ncbi:hypothetical protein K435DRAFT_857754 [Dendrothele bispora CBS 962.96]|uniref:Spt5 transcription elongation factor N-terminal domain-containing protein n=1 Tax=Dendrothele bispora (strain CBS 962.96) TaxID=1314807 RepID=A0A4S8M4U7_DENBC|nr:hypothetical protein K435DRAFT_857754 [Dendrothele bispora CBS 962.96]